jgi:hypothetical protein
MDLHALVAAAQELDEWFGEHATAFGLTTDTGAQQVITHLHTALHTNPIVISVRSPEQQQLINALLIYMDQDQCICDPCTDPGCMGCMYCIAHSALVAIGYIQEEEQQKHDRQTE